VEKATISELKNRLSAYLKKVRAGHSVLILDRDQPVAKLEAVGGGTPHDDKLARLERAGLIRRATSRSLPEALLAAAPAASRSVTEALIAERRDAR
jgi:antitoxin (DNA-binding transcriptional repressor) of toxin-antitoxin stability system